MNTTRQRNEDQYVMPVEASRRGAHRARVSPLLGALPVVAVAVVVVGVVLLAWTVLGGSGGGPSTAAPAGGISTAGPGSRPTGSAPAETEPAVDDEPDPPVAPSTPPVEPPASEPASTVDQTLKIVVRNSTSIAGLARGAASKLTAKGWTINGIPDNYRPAIPTTVFYAEESQEASASAVAKVLSVDLVKQDATMAAKGITVVLGSDYQR